jgi:RNA-splicing ligase RtcB
MIDSSMAPLRSWLAAPLDRDVAEALERLRRTPDVQQVAVMPDVHLATDVCIAVVIATSHLIYPQAVGGDIGCGMLAVAVDREAGALKNPKIAVQLLSELGCAIPARRRNRDSMRLFDRKIQKSSLRWRCSPAARPRRPLTSSSSRAGFGRFPIPRNASVPLPEASRNLRSTH